MCLLSILVKVVRCKEMPLIESENPEAVAYQSYDFTAIRRSNFNDLMSGL